MIAAILLALLAEGVARYYGLHRPLLYETTPYGYRVRPDQHLQRFGNRVSYNSFGMRSEPVDPIPAPGVLRVLCVGDSITNGGTLTDQAQTYPYLLDSLLRSRIGAVEVLNASAGGWALENEEGWLRSNGIFGSRVVVLEVATHDLFQPIAQSSVVDGHPSFPSHAPYLALEEAVARYLVPRVFPGISFKDPGTEAASREPLLARTSVYRVAAMALLVREKGGIPVVLHVEQAAALEPRDATTQDAKRLLAAELAVRGIESAFSADALNARGGQRLFRDEVHPNPDGNRVLAEVVADAIARLVRH